jgi:hypothetical protein
MAMGSGMTAVLLVLVALGCLYLGGLRFSLPPRWGPVRVTGVLVVPWIVLEWASERLARRRLEEVAPPGPPGPVRAALERLTGVQGINLRERISRLSWVGLAFLALGSAGIALLG